MWREPSRSLAPVVANIPYSITSPVVVRLATAAFLAVLAAIGASLSPPVFVALTALIMVFLTAFESVYDDRFVSE